VWGLSSSLSRSAATIHNMVVGFKWNSIWTAVLEKDKTTELDTVHKTANANS
jgi:hypothetical protein